MPLLRPAFSLVPLVLAALGSAQSVTLRYKPPVGKTIVYTSVTSMSMDVPGATAPMSFTQTMPLTYRVVSRAGGVTTIQTKAGQVKVTTPPNSPMAAQRAMIEKQSSGMVSTIKVDELGRLKSMGSNGAPGAAMANQMGAGMASGAQNVTYPQGPIKVGDTWGSTLDLGKALGSAGMGMGMKATGKIPISYRLVGIEKRGGTTLAKIAMTMNGTTAMSMGGAGAPGGKSFAMTLRMRSAGTMLVDSATGLLQSMSSTTDTATAIMGQNMKQHVTTTMTAK